MNENGMAVQDAPRALALPVAEVKAQVQQIQQLMKETMTENEHFGEIPGTNKPTLLKAGAEKLCLMFRLDPEYEITKDYIGDHLTIISKCTLYHITTGQRMGSGMGSCSTKESKYAYRNANRKCPKCNKETIIKGKAEFGGGWLCYKAKGGCGSKWNDGSQEIEGQNAGKVANDQIADTYNTVLKMANKRSLVAAVLNVTAASDIFTQDLEDSAEPAKVSAANVATKQPESANGRKSFSGFQVERVDVEGEGPEAIHWLVGKVGKETRRVILKAEAVPQAKTLIGKSITVNYIETEMGDVLA